MEKTSLGKTGLEVTPLCYGTWQISTEWNFRAVDRPLMLESMRKAIELDINFFDTADAYGDGLAEEIVGEALGVFKREDYVLATKVFHHFYPDGRRHPDLSKDYIIKECEASLSRLGTDYIDLYQCHAFDPLSDFEETSSAMEELKSSGKIRAYGVSNYSAEQLSAARKFGAYASCQPFYSLLERGAEKDVLPLCKAENIGVLSYSTLHRGLLTGKYEGGEKFTDNRARHSDFNGERFRELCGKVRGLEKTAADYGLTITQLVIAATIANPMIDSAITGIKKPSHIEEAAGAVGKIIAREDYFRILDILS